MADRTLPLVTTAPIIFAVLFVVSGVFLILRQYLRYHYRVKLHDVEHKPASAQPKPDDPQRQ